jgi:alkylation response protein AidB-like acyl-CoA dehydrogenase
MSETTLQQSMEVAEAARETEWKHPSFAAGIFGGNINLDLILPYPEPTAEDRAEGDVFLEKLGAWLKANVDGEKNDIEGKLPKEVIDGLAKLGCFGMKIPKEYGGLGLSQVNYNRAVALVATSCAATAVWLSAHQSIGVPQPLKMFGAPEQKKKYLPRFAAGAISAFALTEPDVGSDPARMKTTATPTPDGAAYVINGEKLWCTNGPDADVIVVMARTPSIMKDGKEKAQITAFIVETNSPGFEVAHRCEFMGIRALSNGLLRFNDVRVPKENILLGEGKGLKLALATLNTGRLTLPAACGGAAKQAFGYARRWAAERVQWGSVIGKHDAISGMLTWMAARIFAMEAVTYYASALADRGGADIRLEAAMAKLFASDEACKIADEALQIRGGRGFETSRSLRRRGEKGWPVERILRDLRINRIIEGSSEIMHLFIAREALDPHMKAAGALANPRSSLGEKAASFVKAGLHYSTWYPGRFVAPSLPSIAELPEKLQDHAIWFESASRLLSRRIFYALAANGPKLEKRQRILFRFVDIGTWLFAMIASVAKAAALEKQGVPGAADLADLFCRRARQEIEVVYGLAASNTDRLDRQMADRLLAGELAWLEAGALVE